MMLQKKNIVSNMMFQNQCVHISLRKVPWGLLSFEFSLAVRCLNGWLTSLIIEFHKTLVGKKIMCILDFTDTFFKKWYVVNIE